MPFSRSCDFRSECAYFAEYYSSRTATTTPKDPCSLEHGRPEVRSRDVNRQYIHDCEHVLEDLQR